MAVVANILGYAQLFAVWLLTRGKSGVLHLPSMYRKLTDCSTVNVPLLIHLRLKEVLAVIIFEVVVAPS